MVENRGIRNRNPGNIRLGDNWVGLAEMQPDKEFCTFSHVKYGIRALYKILKKYQLVYNLKSVKEIINRYAPPNENNTGSYINSVAKRIGVKPTETIDVNDKLVALELIKAIIKHENGTNPYTDEQIMEGINLL